MEYEIHLWKCRECGAAFSSDELRFRALGPKFPRTWFEPQVCGPKGLIPIQGRCESCSATTTVTPWQYAVASDPRPKRRLHEIVLDVQRRLPDRGRHPPTKIAGVETPSSLASASMEELEAALEVVKRAPRDRVAKFNFVGEAPECKYIHRLQYDLWLREVGRESLYELESASTESLEVRFEGLQRDPERVWEYRHVAGLLFDRYEQEADHFAFESIVGRCGCGARFGRERFPELRCPGCDGSNLNYEGCNDGG